MRARLVTNEDGSQFIVAGDIDNISVTISDTVPTADVVDLELPRSEVEETARQLQTHRANFDTMTKKMKYTKRPALPKKPKQAHDA